MKLSELLQLVVGKLNKAVSTDPQNLSDEQKAQAKANLGISESSGGANWSENDPNSPAYVKNRTHYMSSTSTVFDESVTFDPILDPEMGDYWTSTTFHRSPIDFRQGDTIIISMDGTSCTEEVQVNEDEHGARTFYVLCEELELKIHLPPVLPDGYVGEVSRYGLIECVKYPVTETFTAQVAILANVPSVVKLPREYIPMAEDNDGPMMMSQDPVSALTVLNYVGNTKDRIIADVGRRLETDVNYYNLQNKPCYDIPEHYINIIYRDYQGDLVPDGTLLEGSAESPVRFGEMGYLDKNSNYLVHFQDVDYLCKPWRSEGHPGTFIGNGKYYHNDIPESEGAEPFCVHYVDGLSTLYFEPDTPYGEGVDGRSFYVAEVIPRVVKKLDEDLLPDSVLTLSETEMSALESLLGITNTEE